MVVIAVASTGKNKPLLKPLIINYFMHCSSIPTYFLLKKWLKQRLYKMKF